MINKEVVVFQIEDMLSNISIENLLTNGGYIENGTAFLELMTNVLALLKEQPELVRCRDCKNRPDEHTTELDGKLYRYCELHRRWTTDDWFCADGERLKDEDEDEL